jgi:hypothetical protein
MPFPDTDPLLLLCEAIARFFQDPINILPVSCMPFVAIELQT